MSGMFASAENLDSYNATDAPDISSVTDIKGMFVNANQFNADLDNWDTSNVTNMRSMFGFASSFNQNISSWCIENISSKPTDFDNNAGFDGQTGKHPNSGNWGGDGNCS